MNKFFKKLHLWVSVPFGIVIAIICFTGALLVFESDIVALYNKDVLRVKPAGEPLPLTTLIARVEQGLADGAEVTGVVVPSDPSEAYKVNVSKPSRAAVYVDQYTGEVKGQAVRLPFFSEVRRLHRWLMDTRPKDGGIFWGKMIVGTSTLAFVAIMLTGLVIWWPRNRKMLKNRLRIVFGKSLNRFWYDLHVAGGFYAMLLLLAMGLTGLTWSYKWYSEGLYSMFSTEASQSGVDKVHVEEGAVSSIVKPDAVSSATPQADAVSAATPQADAVSGATVLDDGESSKYWGWQKAFETLNAEYAGYKTITVGDGTVTVALGGLGNQRANDKYGFDTNTGALTSATLYADASARSKASGWVSSLHFGSWGGMVTKVLYFLAALLGATLPLTGYYFWIKRLYGKRK